jgi:hypothetical protein
VATQASTREKVVQHARENLKFGHDTAKSVMEGKVIDIVADKPTRTISTNEDDAARAIEQKGSAIKCEAKIEQMHGEETQCGRIKAKSML